MVQKDDWIRHGFMQVLCRKPGGGLLGIWWIINHCQRLLMVHTPEITGYCLEAEIVGIH